MTIDRIFDTNASARRIAARYFDEAAFDSPDWLAGKLLPLEDGHRLEFFPVNTWGIWEGYVTVSLFSPDGTVLDIVSIDEDNIKRYT